MMPESPLKTTISPVAMFSLGVGIDITMSPILILGFILPLIITRNLTPSRKDTKRPVAKARIKACTTSE
jgi:hypothetical protein